MAPDAFGSAASARLIALYAGLRPYRDTLASAAVVYLARFDASLSAGFVRASLTRAARAVARGARVTLPDAHALVNAEFRAASRAYFAEAWRDPDAYVRANAAAVVEVRRANARRGVEGRGGGGVREVDGVGLDFLVAEASEEMPVVVKVYADYCSVCKAMAAEFEGAAADVGDGAVFVAIDGPRNVATTQGVLEVRGYPAVLRFSGGRPVRLARMVRADIARFARAGGGTEVGKCLSPPPVPGGDAEGVSEMLRMGGLSGQWAGMLRRQGIDQLDALVRDRDAAMASSIDDALQCRDAFSCPVPPAFIEGSTAEPVAILLGGGMGSGKSASMHALSDTAFWRERGAAVVVVEADAFKHRDPLFSALNAVGARGAARIVHGKSLEGAEALFLKATQERRDVVFDGTMAWKPFVLQTLAMLRDNEHVYERGPGYRVGEDGVVTEEYWVKAGRRKFPVVPYRVEVVGVTVDPAIAVERGVVRKLLTQRGVPIAQQLESHRQFSENFEDYMALVDSGYLFDNCVADEHCESPASAHEAVVEAKRSIIAAKRGVLFPDGAAPRPDGFVVYDHEAYRKFLRKRFLNVKAGRAEELYEMSEAACADKCRGGAAVHE